MACFGLSDLIDFFSEVVWLGRFTEGMDGQEVKDCSTAPETGRHLLSSAWLSNSHKTQ